MKEHLKGKISSDQLSPQARIRFSALFGVAAKKSVFDWHESPALDAQVVLIDASSDPLCLRPLAPCTIWVGYDRPILDLPGPWLGHLIQDYTVGDLIDILDRAAVFLLDWRARRQLVPYEISAQSQSLNTHSALPERYINIQVTARSAEGSQSVARVHTTKYRLNAWVFLAQPFDSSGCISALALLTSQPVTVQQLRAHSGLTPAELSKLLNELARRKVLEVIQPVEAIEPLSLSTEIRRKSPVNLGFVRRLSHWIRRTNKP